MVAVIPVELYEQLIAERAERFQVLDRIRENAPNLEIEEIEKDIQQAIEAVRRNR
jgi:RecJ-like exonuclease